MSNDAEKYLVTSDRGYLDKLQQTARDYGSDLRRFEAQSLDAARARHRLCAARRRLATGGGAGRSAVATGESALSPARNPFRAFSRRSSAFASGRSSSATRRRTR